MSGDALPTPAHDVRLPQEPVRTCVGCRERAVRSVLLRVVVAEVDGRSSVVPDPDRRLAGRGASLHLEPACLDAAERRKVFPRALRHVGPLDTGELRAYLVAVRCPEAGQAPTEGHLPAPSESESGSEADEHPMSAQR